MQLEDYFDILAPDDIQLRGTRVGIETVLYDHIHRARTPEQVHATIVHYLHDRERIGAYLGNWLAAGQRARAAQESDPHARQLLDRLRQARGARRQGAESIALADPA